MSDKGHTNSIYSKPGKLDIKAGLEYKQVKNQLVKSIVQLVLICTILLYSSYIHLKVSVPTQICS